MGDKSVRDKLEDKKREGGFDKKSLLEGLSPKMIKWIIAIAVVGVLMTFIPKKANVNNDINQVPVVQTNQADPSDESGKAYETDLEKRLENILSKIDGVGEVEVMVTLATTKEKVLAQEIKQTAKDTAEVDNAGATRNIQEETIDQQIVKSGGTVPFVIKEEMPAIEGAIVVAEGGDDVVVQSKIIESVSSVLGIPVHKVSVSKMGTN